MDFLTEQATNLIYGLVSGLVSGIVISLGVMG